LQRHAKLKLLYLFIKVKEDETPPKDKGCSDREILAILGHELGHWKLNHILKNLVISQVSKSTIFILFLLCDHY